MIENVGGSMNYIVYWSNIQIKQALQMPMQKTHSALNEKILVLKNYPKCFKQSTQTLLNAHIRDIYLSTSPAASSSGK